MKQLRLSFPALALALIRTTREQHRFSTALNYRTAFRSFHKFMHHQDFDLRDITPERLTAWRIWLREQGCCQNTTACYTKSLRAIYNKVYKETPSRSKLRKQESPFSDLAIAMTTTEKRAVNQQELQRLMALPLRESSHLALARDLFLFSFYAMGMPFVDVAYLRPSQIREGWLTYERHKTGQRVRVALLPEMLDILHRRAAKQGSYVFPLLHTTDAAQANLEYQSRLRCYNNALRELSRRAHLQRRLTSYVARHTWASLAFSHEMPLPIISQALGHRNTNTTLFYIRSIDDTRLADANRQLMSQLLHPNS